MNTEWKPIPISDISLGVYDGPHATPPTSNDGPIYLGIGNITEDGHLDLSYVRHIAEKDFAQWTRRVTPQAGDIVFTYEATLNRYAIIPEGFRGCLGRRTALIRPDPRRVDTRFLFYSFFGQKWRNTIEANRLSGATVDRIPIARFPQFPVLLPSLETQRRIASVLGTYDDLIEVNRKRIALMEEMARRLFEEWFVRFRYPGHEGYAIDETSQGVLPPGWKLGTADELIEFEPRMSIAKEGRKPFIPMDSLSTTNSLIGQIEWREGNSGARFKNGDTLFARITPCLENGKTGLVRDLPDNGVGFGSTEFIVMRGREAGPAFCYLLARHDTFREHAQKSMSGATGRQRARTESLRTFQLPLPVRSTLDEFERKAWPVLELSGLLGKANVRLAVSRDLLLPHLISGELSVSAAERELEAVA
jgi:type I restriction enzyme S subunit